MVSRLPKHFRNVIKIELIWLKKCTCTIHVHTSSEFQLWIDSVFLCRLLASFEEVLYYRAEKSFTKEKSFGCGVFWFSNPDPPIFGQTRPIHFSGTNHHLNMTVQHAKNSELKLSANNLGWGVDCSTNCTKNWELSPKH